MVIHSIRERFRGRGIVNDRFFDVHGCKVDLRSFPSDTLVLDVDRMIQHDNFANEITTRYNGQRESICDYVIFTCVDSQFEIILLEAKGGQYEAFRHSEKAVKQLASSKLILQRAIRDCVIDLSHCSVQTAYVTAEINWSDDFRQHIKDVINEAGIFPRRVPSGWDVWQAIYG